MSRAVLPTSAFADTKPHYVLLDGLRGVAAVMAVCYHIFEAFATSHLDQHINHGYLVVDFFFLLSGFVMGYAYDTRWRDRTMGAKEFFLRRLIRLHPMVVLGAGIGALLFFFGDYEGVKVAQVSFGVLLIAFALNALLIPITPAFDAKIRGWGEMYPLNGPSWSLFFEYIGNLLYALFIRRLPTWGLAILVALVGGGLAVFAMTGPLGDLGAGYALTEMNFTGGSLRVLFSFSAGLLLSRVFRPMKIKGAFWICTLVIISLLAIPRFGGQERFWLNGLYETICVVVIFPILLWIGASGRSGEGSYTHKVCRFLGDISYPLYIVHYPLICIYIAWVRNNELSFGESLPGAIGVVAGSVLLAYVALKFYDIPVRKFLTRKFLPQKDK